MERYRGRYLASLSGGEAQRAWIAMALAQKPKLLLLDEPTTYLDIAHQLDVLELIAKLNRELKLTVVMVLHDLNHASTYSDKICVIKDGDIRVFGKPHAGADPQRLRGRHRNPVRARQHQPAYSRPEKSAIKLQEKRGMLV